MSTLNRSLSIAPPPDLPKNEKLGLAILSIGLLSMIVALAAHSPSPVIPFLLSGFFMVTGVVIFASKKKDLKSVAQISLFIGVVSGLFLFVKGDFLNDVILSVFTFGFLIAGGLIYILTKYKSQPGAIQNNGIYHSILTKKNGTLGWILGIVITGFYVVLYWYPSLLHGLIMAADPVMYALFGRKGITYGQNGEIFYNQWLLYGLFYTIAVLLMGFRFILKYRHNKYMIIRTISVMAAQTLFAFLIPNILAALNHQELYFHYFWPLDYDVLFPDNFNYILSGGKLGHFFFWWSLVIAFIAVPILTYFYGKRWYCSWVCGCGGLAETAGDPFRHLSDKSLKAWQIERILIYAVLAAITITTILVLADWQLHFLPGDSSRYLQKAYGFVIGQVFAGVIGVGFYPIMGSRIWCRFGCPQAAILGILQKYFSRFRITTNGGQCISCGNCSTYCEMGIDVRWYAQREQNFARASCVGCGVCSAVCPRGVLKLENGPLQNKTDLQNNRFHISALEPAND
jgi:ferredoxin-type protein NapH